MRKLRYETLRDIGYEGYLLPDAPERVVQFGEGNFLRAFADCFIDIANERCGFDSKVLLVQPIESGLSERINEQEGLYTLYLRGMEAGAPVNRKRVISCVHRCINPYDDYAAYLAAARNPALRYIISNTTEAGIVFQPDCAMDDTPPASFPAKLTRFLYERYLTFPNGQEERLILLPCELIDDNGGALERCVKQYAALWQLGEDFSRWLEREVLICPTLVDRIVTGYPRAEAEALNAENGYTDDLLDTGEAFGLWVIEGPEWLKEALPFDKAGLPVLITPDHKPYKQRKVRILNGAHTTLSLAAYLAGKDTVRECMDDARLYAFLRRAMFEEIIPTLTLPEEELTAFADAVLQRFGNPYIAHSLLSISLNSVSKWRARVLPSVQGYVERFGSVPPCLTFGFAALLQFYLGDRVSGGKLSAQRDGQPYEVMDEESVLSFFAAHFADEPGELVRAVCQNVEFWGMDLSGIPGFVQAATRDLTAIRTHGMAQAMEGLARQS